MSIPKKPIRERQFEYTQKIKRFSDLFKLKNPDWNTDSFDPDFLDFADEDYDEILELKDYLVNENSFKKALPRQVALWIVGLDTKRTEDIGGYKIYDEKFFTVDGQKYSVIVFGNSEENEGEDCISGIIFVLNT